MDRFFLAVLLSSALLSSSCSSTRVEGTWSRPAFGGRSITGPVFVVGVMRDETVRRLYEDRMAAKLTALGIPALKSYEDISVPLQGKADPVFDTARREGARYLLSSAVIGHRQQTVVDAPAMVGYGGWYSRNWGVGMAGPTTIRQYDVFAVETSLVDVATDRIEWTVRTRSTAGSDLDADVRDFADAILGEMSKAGLVPPEG
jgi:hypothetical protein